MVLTLMEVQTLVTDLERSLDFYTRVLELPLQQKGADWAIFSLSGIDFVILSGALPAESSAGDSSLCGTMAVLATSDLEETMDKLRKRGVSFLGPVVTVPQGQYVRIQDPDGNGLEIAQPKA